MSRNLPPTANVAQQQDGAKLHAPAAERNADALCTLIRAHAPKTGRALEIASGTGQHIIAFAAALPDLNWQPSDVASNRLNSINAYVAEAGLNNIAPAVALDATTSGWSRDHLPKDLIILINLLHLISTCEAQTVIAEAAQTLAPHGTLIMYGPFARDGQLTSAGDIEFDAQLRGADPDIGYKDTTDMTLWLQRAHLSEITMHEMPANNLAFVAGKPKT